MKYCFSCICIFSSVNPTVGSIFITILLLFCYLRGGFLNKQIEDVGKVMFSSTPADTSATTFIAMNRA